MIDNIYFTMYLELIGWIATVFIILSFIQKDMFRLRLLSLVGALFWAVYGLISGSWSIVFLNVVVGIIQVYWVCRIRLNKSERN